ncbi:MAG: ComEC/Rec2 family competence protein [Planctomycetaceae bacterium]
MEVFFLDMAQGTCQVILLGERRAIVIDCGIPMDRIVLQFLRRIGVEHIERLVVSHSHDDHIGGAVSVLGAYQDRISKICFVQDHLFLQSAFWGRISELLMDQKLAKDQLVRLEASDRPQEIWTDNLKSYRLRTYSPSAAENLLAQEAETPNPTSAVLFLDVRKQRIIFAADSDVTQWREIHRKYGRRMKCEVLAVPHHAGRSHSSAEDLEWLFDHALEVGVAVISVGTTNTHGHPRKDVVEAMSRRGTKILCTQFTRQCNSNIRDLEFLRPGVLQPQLFLGRSSPTKDLTDAGHSRNVACAGTVKIDVTGAGFVIDRLSEHQRAIDELFSKSIACPLCRT